MTIQTFIQKKYIYVIAGLIACILFFQIPPHFSLLIGLLIGLSFGNPLQKISKIATKFLLQTSVVGLGFGMNFTSVVDAGKTGILFTILTIFGALILGSLFGKYLKVPSKIAYLIACGTAICGGSAIAAVSPVLEAEEKEISISMATVFTLNAIALLIFPTLGHLFELSQQQFGLWSALAIHDTSSVVGAATSYGDQALTIATTVKLSRALWIIPLVIITSFVYGKKAGLKSFPFFILLFIGASLVNTYSGLPGEVSIQIVQLAKSGLSITLLLIGTSISIKSIKETGINAFIFGFSLWIIMLVSTFAIVYYYIAG